MPSPNKPYTAVKQGDTKWYVSRSIDNDIFLYNKCTHSVAHSPSSVNDNLTSSLERHIKVYITGSVSGSCNGNYTGSISGTFIRSDGVVDTADTVSFSQVILGLNANLSGSLSITMSSGYLTGSLSSIITTSSLQTWEIITTEPGTNRYEWKMEYDGLIRRIPIDTYNYYEVVENLDP